LHHRGGPLQLYKALTGNYTFFNGINLDFYFIDVKREIL